MAVNEKIYTFMVSDHEYEDRAKAGIYEKTNRHYKAGDRTCHTVMINDDGVDKLIANAGYGYEGEPFEADGQSWVLAPLNHATAATLRNMFPTVMPVPAICGAATGKATAEVFAAFENNDVYPEYVKNAVKALDHANSTCDEVLDCATFSMFRNM